MGIAYQSSNGQIKIATRGSFESTQALSATQIWAEKYEDVKFGPYVTPLFEIIVPDNRIVVDYGDTRDLVLLAVVDNTTGADLPLIDFNWPGPSARQYRFDSFSSLITHVLNDDSQHQEGYVIRFNTGDNAPHVRLKLKFPEYVAHHRIVTGLTVGKIWEVLALADAQQRNISAKQASAILRLDPARAEHMMNMKPDPVEGYRQTLPEEFVPWYDSIVLEITEKTQTLISKYRDLVAEANVRAEDASQKAFAIEAIALAKAHQMDTRAIFSLKHNKDTAYTTLWATARPDNHRQPATRF